MEYEIMICGAGNLVFNLENKSVYKEYGNNLLGALVIKTDSIDEDKFDVRSKTDDIFDDHFQLMLDSSLLFSDEDMKVMLLMNGIDLKLIDEYFFVDSSVNPELFDKMKGIRLLVEQIEVIDYRNGNEDKADSDDVNEIIHSEFYDPDDWEFVLKVKKVL